MAIKITRNLSLLIWSVMIILSISGLITAYITYQELFYNEPFQPLFLIFSWFCLIITSISFYRIIFSITSKNKNKKDIEENINEFYRYKKLSDPPDSNMYN